MTRRPRVLAVVALAALIATGAWAVSRGSDRASHAAHRSRTARPTANVWVARTGSDQCTRSGIRLTLARAAGHVCRHWDPAYRAASSARGDVVRVVDGIYESTSSDGNSLGPDRHQDLDAYLIRDDPSKRRGHVTFACGTPGSHEGVTFAHGDSVILGDRLTIDGGGDWRTRTPSCFRFRDVETGFSSFEAGADDLTLAGSHLAAINVFGGRNVTIRRDEIGPSVACGRASSYTPESDRCRNRAVDDEAYWFAHDEQPTFYQTQYTSRAPGCSAQSSPHHLVWDDNWIHDSNALDLVTWHTGQLQNGGFAGCGVQATGLIFTRNLFERNVVAMLAPSVSDDDVLIENNVFADTAEGIGFTHGCTPALDCPLNQHGANMMIDVNTGWGDGVGTGWTVRFNTFKGPLRVNGSFQRSRVYGNLFEASALSCGAIPYSDNVWAARSTPCPGTRQRRVSGSLVAAPGFRARGHADFHLRGSARVARGLVAPTDCPRTDFDGRPRPKRGRCAVGAEER